MVQYDVDCSSVWSPLLAGLLMVAMEGREGIDEESAADVFPVRQSSEGAACSVAWLRGRGPRRVLMAPVLLVTTAPRWTVANLARCNPPTLLRQD